MGIRAHLPQAPEATNAPILHPQPGALQQEVWWRPGISFWSVPKGHFQAPALLGPHTPAHCSSDLLCCFPPPRPEGLPQSGLHPHLPLGMPQVPPPLSKSGITVIHGDVRGSDEGREPQSQHRVGTGWTLMK